MCCVCTSVYCCVNVCLFVCVLCLLCVCVCVYCCVSVCMKNRKTFFIPCEIKSYLSNV